ncbi:YbgA family protein [Candidatus Nitrospira bockiana]
MNQSDHVRTPAPVRIGISRCLLGEPVRYDGGHKRDAFLTGALSRYVEWVPVCPEVEAGLGVPREPMQLVGRATAPRLITIDTGLDRTRTMERFARRRLSELGAMELSGYVFKKDSPSCGVERVRVYNAHGVPSRTGVGVFARAFMERFPLIPVEDEGRLNDPELRENFLERVFAYRRWRDLVHGGATRGALVEFHARHKLLLLSHSREHYRTLGRLVAGATHWTPGELARRYGAAFMAALEIKATPKKHANVLSHMVSHLASYLESQQKAELIAVIEDYRHGLVPLIVPITLVKHYARLYEIPYLMAQVYLNPHPTELMLRNRV